MPRENHIVLRGLMRRTSSAVVGTTLVAALAGCSSTSDGPPRSGDELAQMLVSSDDIAVSGILRDAEYVDDGGEIQPGMGLLPVVGEGNCADAIRAGYETSIATVGAATRAFEAGNAQVASGIYSVEDPEAVSVARLYSDILTYCADPIFHEGTGVEYTVDQLTDPGPDVSGMVVVSRSHWGDVTTMVVMHREIGNHAVAVGSIGFTEPTVNNVFQEQVARLEG